MPDDLARVPEIPVHPAAEAFRLMSDDELGSLAADIAEHGLREPIKIGRVAGGPQMLVDGRNRLAACRIAQTLAHFEVIDFASDDKVIAYVKSLNERRDLTKGERAMGLAILYPNAPRGRGKSDPARKDAETAPFSYRRVQEARQVLRFSQELALAVRDGTRKLDDALALVASSQGQEANSRIRLNRLRAERPDLADAVTEDVMTLEAAELKAKSDAAQLKQQRWAVTVNLLDALSMLDREPSEAADTHRFFDPAVEDQRGTAKLDTDRLRRAAAYLSALADLWGQKPSIS